MMPQLPVTAVQLALKIPYPTRVKPQTKQAFWKWIPFWNNIPFQLILTMIVIQELQTGPYALGQRHNFVSVHHLKGFEAGTLKQSRHD